MRGGHNDRSLTLGTVLNDRGSPELEPSAVCDVPAMGWAWLELLQSLRWSCDRGILLQASGRGALGRSSQPGGAVVPSQQLVRNPRAAQSYKKVKKIN